MLGETTQGRAGENLADLPGARGRMQNPWVRQGCSFMVGHQLGWRATAKGLWALGSTGQ